MIVSLYYCCNFIHTPGQPDHVLYWKVFCSLKFTFKFQRDIKNSQYNHQSPFQTRGWPCSSGSIRPPPPPPPGLLLGLASRVCCAQWKCYGFLSRWINILASLFYAFMNQMCKSVDLLSKYRVFRQHPFNLNKKYWVFGANLSLIPRDH